MNGAVDTRQRAWDVALRVAVAFCMGIGVGSLLIVPFTGALALGLGFGGLMLGAPLALVAAIIAATASQSVYRRPILWSVVASAISAGAYFLFDPPINLWAAQRDAIALLFAACCALAFVWLQRDAVRAATRIEQ
jgi:hypothetical protein